MTCGALQDHRISTFRFSWHDAMAGFSESHPSVGGPHVQRIVCMLLQYVHTYAFSDAYHAVCSTSHKSRLTRSENGHQWVFSFVFVFFFFGFMMDDCRSRRDTTEYGVASLPSTSSGVHSSLPPPGIDTTSTGESTAFKVRSHSRSTRRPFGLDSNEPSLARDGYRSCVKIDLFVPLHLYPCSCGD